MDSVTELAKGVGVARACLALSLPRATFYRRRQLPRVVRPRPSPSRALQPSERQAVLDTLHSPRFVDKAPAEVWATLLDEGIHLCSVRSMYRLLTANHKVRERRDQLRHPSYTKPELITDSLTRPVESK